MYLQKHGINSETVIEQSGDFVLLEFIVPENCDFFEGHFPEFHLLPAVAQIDMVMHFANKYFGLPIFVSAAKRTKFSAPILPNTTVRVEIKFNLEKNTLSYKLAEKDGEKIFSSGILVVGRG